jgi:hypothetical protein
MGCQIYKLNSGHNQTGPVRPGSWITPLFGTGLAAVLVTSRKHWRKETIFDGANTAKPQLHPNSGIKAHGIEKIRCFAKNPRWFIYCTVPTAYRDTINFLKKMRKTWFKIAKKAGTPCCYIPVNTHDTMGTGCSVPWCAKVHTHTHTHTTRFGKPTGFPIPVPNPSYGVIMI